MNLKVNFTNLAEGIQLPNPIFPILFHVQLQLQISVFLQTA